MTPYQHTTAILKKYYQNRDINLKKLLDQNIKKVDKRHTSAITRMVYGILRKEILINEIICTHSSRKIKALEIDVLIFLQMGIFQLIFSSEISEYAVVNELVNLGKKHQKAFLNAILRNISIKKDSIKTEIQQYENSSIRFSINPYIIEELSRLSSNITEDLEYLDQEPVFHLTPYHISLNDLKVLLNRHHVPFRELENFSCFEIKQINSLPRDCLKTGKVFIQNTGSQIICKIAAHLAKSTLIDACAAPGTKSMAIARSRPDLKIIANDINFSRLLKLKETQYKLKINQIHCLVSDFSHPGFGLSESNFILIDAPCSSSGTLRKNPDLKNKINREIVQKNSELQLKIVQNIIPLISKNTFVLYCVCSFIEAETEGIIEQIFKSDQQDIFNKSFLSIDLSQILSEFGFRFKRGKFGFYLMPDYRINNDIFYLSLLTDSSIPMDSLINLKK